MITNAEYILWCACRLRNKYAENSDIWTKLYNIGEEMNQKYIEASEAQKTLQIKQQVFEGIINSDYSNIEELLK